MTGILKGDIIIRKSFFKTKDLAAARGEPPGTDQEEAPAETPQEPPGADWKVTGRRARQNPAETTRRGGAAEGKFLG